MISGWVKMNAAAERTTNPRPMVIPPSTTAPVTRSQNTLPSSPMNTPSEASARGGRPNATRLTRSPRNATIPVGMKSPKRAMKNPATPSPLESLTGTMT